MAAAQTQAEAVRGRTKEAQAKLERSQSDLGSAAAVAQQKLDALAGTISALPRPAAFGGGS